MKRVLNVVGIALGVVLWCAAHAADAPKPKPVINPPPTAKDWADLSKLPDWSGVWNPKIKDKDAQEKTNMPTWNAKEAELINYQLADEKADRTQHLFIS